MTCFPIGDQNILPKKDLHRSLQVECERGIRTENDSDKHRSSFMGSPRKVVPKGFYLPVGSYHTPVSGYPTLWL